MIMLKYVWYLVKLLFVIDACGWLGKQIFHHRIAGYTFWILVLLWLYVPRIIHHFRIKKYQSGTGKARINDDGNPYRDLNGNGVMDVYEDPTAPVRDRVEDLLAQMTLEEKAGLMFSPQTDVVKPSQIVWKGGFVFGGDAVKQIFGRNISTFCAMGSLSPREFARWNNAIQQVAESTRLGIPVTVCSDPRNIYIDKTNNFTMQKDDGVSAWPLFLGIGATQSEEIAYNYGKIAGQELRAMGIRFALHPVADTATEPRWPRLSETFGQDAELNGRLARAYIRGMQGENMKTGVACCIKHFPGGGPQKDGDDPHFQFGREQVYPGNNFDYHLKPFETVIEDGVEAVMPYYGMPVGLDGVEEVGFNFNRDITKKILREKMGYDGIIHSDYTIIDGQKIFGLTFYPGRAWGLEKKSRDEVLIQALDAGLDQIGGEFCVRRLVRLVKQGKISEERINESCRRILSLKFRQGLFDDPYVDEDNAEKVCGKAEYRAAGREAMEKSLVLLKKDCLPLPMGCKVYCEGMDKRYLEGYATAVDSPEEADFCLVKLANPTRWDWRDLMTYLMEGGSLEYTDKEKKRYLSLMQKKPTVAIIHMSRPAVIPEIKEHAGGILEEFGADPKALLDAVFGVYSPSGKLPVTMPESMAVIKDHMSDLPYDGPSTYQYGDGLQYE